ERGSSQRRLRPLFLGWFLTLLIGLGGTTPVAPVLLGSIPKALIGVDFFNVLTYERLTFWATLMTLPFVGLLAAELVRRWDRPAITTPRARSPNSPPPERDSSITLNILA